MEANRLQTIENWRASQTQLDEAIERYLQSTISLSSIPSDVVQAYSVSGTGGSNIWKEINYGLQSTPSRIQSLKKGAEKLSLIRNRSPSLVPINKLPPEILVQIFCLCVIKPKSHWRAQFACGSYHYHLPQLIELSRVCSLWRGLIINEPSFWSHFTLSPDRTRYSGYQISWDRVQTSLERSSGQTLCLTIPGYKFPTNGPEELQAAFQYLRPLTGNVKHLCFFNCYTYRIFVPWFLTNIGIPDILSLTLIGNDRVNLSLFKHVDQSYPALSESQFELCLLSIRSLHLEKVVFDWKSPVYHNLVSLTLESIPVSFQPHPTVGDILSILSASPNLHTLHLRTLILPTDDESTLPSQVHLGALINLDLRRAGIGLIQLLPRIFITSERLSVSLDVDTDPDSLCRASINNFLARLNVTRLLLEESTVFRIYGDYSIEDQIVTSAMQDTYSVVPHLKSLTVIGSSSMNLLEVMTRATPTNELEPCFLTLRTLYAVSCTLNEADIEKITKAYPGLKRIRLVKCKLPVRPDFDEWLAHTVKCAKVIEDWEVNNISRDYYVPTCT